MTQGQRDVLALVSVAFAIGTWVAARRVAKDVAAAKAKLTRSPFSWEGLKDRAIDQALDLPFDLVKP